jgi:hypothetical protein
MQLMEIRSRMAATVPQDLPPPAKPVGRKIIAGKNIKPAYVNHVSEPDHRTISSMDTQQDVMQRCAAPGAAKQANRSVDHKGGSRLKSEERVRVSGERLQGGTSNITGKRSRLVDEEAQENGNMGTRGRGKLRKRAKINY